MARFTTILLIVAMAGPGLAQQIHWIEPGSGHLPNGSIRYFEDTTARLGIREIVALSGRFKPLRGSLLNKGYTASHHWLHLRLHSRTPQTAFLNLDNPRINTFHCYQFVKGRQIGSVVAGDEQPFAARGFPSYNWVVPVTLDAQTPVDLYVLVAKRHEVLGVRVRAWAGQTFERNDRNGYLWWGMLTGFTLLILLINGVGLVATRQAVYLGFIGLILAVALHIATQSGLGFQYLWPNWPGFNRFDPQLLSGWLIMGMQLWFMQQFISQRAGPRMAGHAWPGQSWAFGPVRTFQYVLLGGLVLNVVLRAYDVFPENHFRWTFNTTLALTVVSIGLAFWSIFERIGRRENVVLFYTFTFSVQLVGYGLVFIVNLAFTRGTEPLFEFDSYVIVVLNFLFDLLVLSSGILYFWFQSYRRQNEQLLTTLHQQQQAQSGRIIEALELERNRIAEDLYDDVGAMLSTAIGYVSSVLRKPDVRDRYPLLTEARHLLDRAVDNLRTVSHNLMPKNFAELGLARSLAETIDKVSARTDIRVRFIQTGSERRLDAGTEVQIFRIAAELINDIVKNSGATQATVQLVYGPDTLLLMTEDDRTTFRGPNPPQYNNLYSKLAFVDGQIDSDTSPDGVTVRVNIPY